MPLRTAESNAVRAQPRVSFDYTLRVTKPQRVPWLEAGSGVETAAVSLGGGVATLVRLGPRYRRIRSSARFAGSVVRAAGTGPHEDLEAGNSIGRRSAPEVLP